MPTVKLLPSREKQMLMKYIVVNATGTVGVKFFTRTGALHDRNLKNHLADIYGGPSDFFVVNRKTGRIVK